MPELIGNCYIDGIKAIGFKNEFDTELVVPDGVEIIGKSAFYKYYGMERITLPDSLKLIEDDAFRDCSNLRKIVIPQNVESLPKSFFGAFWGCKQLVEADLSNCKIEVLYDNSFYECKKLQVIKLPKSLIKIEKNCFYKCTGLRDIVFNDGIKVIDDDFDSCKMLHTINIPDSVIHIKDLSDNENIKCIVLSSRQKEMFYEYLPNGAELIIKD